MTAAGGASLGGAGGGGDHGHQRSTLPEAETAAAAGKG